MKKNLPALIVMFFALSACTPAATEPGMDEPVTNETAMPQPSEPIPTPSPVDSNPVRGNAYLDSAELLTLESFPLQFTLVLKGNLPTPCHQLRVSVSTPDGNNKILVEVYSLSSPDAICAQVLQPFSQNIPLGSFPSGHYTLWVNGEQVAEFEA